MNLGDLRRQGAVAQAVLHGIGGLFRMRRQTRPSSQPPSEGPSVAARFRGAAAAAFAGAFLGCLATLHLRACGFAPAIASASATILLCGPVLAARMASLISSEFFTAVYGGTFAGMTSVLWLSEDLPERSVMLVRALLILLSIVCGLFFCVVAAIDTRTGRRIAGGYGGRSGAIAAAASFVFVELGSLLGADDAWFRAPRVDLFDLDPRSVALGCAACWIGMVATLLVLRRQRVATAGTASRTFLAAAIALIGLIALHLHDPNDTRTAEAFYAGCFLGMSTPERLKGWTQPLLGAIVLTAMLVVVSALLPGLGGSLGFAAFVTGVVLLGLNGMFGGGRSLDNATQEIVRGRLLQLRAYASANPMFGIGKVRAIAVAASIAVLLVAGWLVLPHQLASQEDQENAAASGEVTGPSAPVPPQPVLARTTPGSDDDGAIPPGQIPANAVDADRAVVTEQHLETDATQAAGAGGAADAAADAGHVDRAEATATPGTETPQNAAPVADVPEAHQELFRQFVRWDAEHASAQAPPPPAKRARNPQLHLVRLTPADSSPQARAGRRPDRPNSASGPQAGSPASVRSDPRRPVRSSAISAAPGESTP